MTLVQMPESETVSPVGYGEFYDTSALLPAMPRRKVAPVAYLEQPAPQPPEPTLAEQFGRFDDLVGVNKAGRAYRDGYKFLSNHELALIAEHQDLIRSGIGQLAVELIIEPLVTPVQTREQKLMGIYGANYRQCRAAQERSQTEAEPAAAPILATPEVRAARAFAARREEAERVWRNPPRASLYPRVVYPQESHWQRLQDWAMEPWSDMSERKQASLGLGATAAILAIGAMLLPAGTDSHEDDYYATTPPVTHTKLAPQSHGGRDILPAQRTQTEQGSKPEVTATRIHAPRSITLAQRKGGDTIWQEVSETIQIDGHKLSAEQTAAVVPLVMQDNHVESETQAEHLPVGFTARITHRVRALVRSFGTSLARRR